MIQVTKKNPITGENHTEELDITQEQLDRYELGKEKVQDIFTNLNADEREFLISGIPIGKFDEMFPEEEDDDEEEDY